MRVGSLFSGIGGLDLGLERAGMEIVWQVEVNEWCRRVLERHWPDVGRFSDVRELTRKQLAPVDVICGGFPCQPVSHAGRRAGESDSRWLWPEFHRIICEVKPRWVLVENVPGLRSVDDGRLFGGILRDLAEAGYDAVWFDLSAADVGAPHLRYRVFIVAYTDDERPQGRERRVLQERPRKLSVGSGSALVANTQGIAGQDGQAEAQRQGRLAGSSDTNADSESPFRPPITREECHPWTVEPDVGRVATRISSRVDRLRGLGNAVVPQVAEVIGRWIMEVAREH